MKNNLLHALRQVFQLATSTQFTLPEALEYVERQQALEARRNFLKTTAKASLVIGLGGATAFPQCARLPYTSKTRIAIVGAGMAGLTAAYHFRRKGVSAVVFEGDKRIGGRIKSARIFNNGQLNTEIGAEFIDTSHQDMLYMARVAGLHENLMDVEKDTLTTRDAFFIEGKHRTLGEILAEFKDFYPRIQADQGKMEGKAASVFDKLSMADYIEDMPVSAWLKKLLHAAYLGENGLETSEQSAANLLSIFEIKNQRFYPFGSSDERFKVIGGNEQIPQKIGEMLRDQIRLEHKLVTIRENENQSFTLVFNENGTTRQENFDVVLMTLPFTILRELDIQMELPPSKKRIISELGYGVNAKFIVETQNRPWRELGYRGYLFNEIIPNGWDSTQMQNDNKGAGTFTCYFGGNRGRAAMRGSENAQLEYIIPQLDAAFPGTKAALTGKMELAAWPSNPFVKASYSCFKPGQVVPFEGQAATPVRNLYFAGEHCSTEYWGFMNGAAETGRKAAESILKKMKIS